MNVKRGTGLLTGEWILSFTSVAHVCVLQDRGAKEVFQKGFRANLKNKNRYARYVAGLRRKSEMFEGELRAAAQHRLSRTGDTGGIALISFPGERRVR